MIVTASTGEGVAQVPVGPVVSVIIAAFNAEHTLDEQLEAMLRQEVPFEWELLVCDNGSTDGTAALVRSWQNRLPQLRLIDASARRGASAARNIGASLARATLLAFCDADDVVADDWLLRMRRALRRSALVAGAGETTRLNPPGQASVSWSVDTVITKPYWPRYPAAASSNLGVSAPAFREVKGFDESLRTGEDIDLCWRMQLAGARLVRHPEVVVHIRKRVGIGAVFRQAYSYSVGDRQLRHKYAAHIADQTPPERATPERATPEGEHRAATSSGGRLGRLRRVLSRTGIANVAWRLGQWWGSRGGSMDDSAPRVETLPR